MVFGCIVKNFSENIFWCLEKKKENSNQKMQNNTNQNNTSHKSRKTQIQNNRSKLRLVHSKIFTENASNQAKKPKPSKRNATGSSIAPSIDDRADERCASDECARPTSTDERCASDERARRSRLAISSIAPRARRSRRAISSIAPVDRRSRRAISQIAIVDRAGAIVALSSLSLSDLGFLFSLSLSLFPEVI